MKEHFVNCKFGDIEIEIRSYKGVDVFKWDNWRYQHKITLSHKGKKANFVFNNSVADYEKGKLYLTDIDMKEALENLISDALLYRDSDSIEHLCSIIGIDDYNESARIYRACKKIYDKLISLDIIPEDLYDIANYLQEELNA